MSEYQRYEFMTSDRPLTRKELDAVNNLSSHIEASSTHALIEYHWGDFKHDAIDVLHKFFDGYLYWANWGSPQLALRFPHGVLPANLLDSYDFDDFVTFSKHQDYDILDIQFGEMESPDNWTEYELGSLIPIREELMEGDQRALYIAWLAVQEAIGYYDEEEEEEEDIEISAPPVPPAFGTLTEAQRALAELLQVSQELLVAAARHSSKAAPSKGDDFSAWIKLLSPDRHDDYLVRLAQNEPGLSHLLVRELRELGKDKTKVAPSIAEHVTYATLLTESKAIQEQLAREKLEQERLARQRELERQRLAREHELQQIHEHQDTYWRQVDKSAERGSGAGYDEAVQMLIKLRDSASRFKEIPAFQARFHAWIQPHLRRATLLKRLQQHDFILPT
jgi:hypothetical protein